MVFAASATVALVHAVWLQVSMNETLTPERRRPFDGKYRNPFTFLSLFNTTPMLTKMTVFNTFQVLTEGKIMLPMKRGVSSTIIAGIWVAFFQWCQR